MAARETDMSKEGRLEVVEDVLRGGYGVDGPVTASEVLDAVGDKIGNVTPETVRGYMDELRERGVPVVKDESGRAHTYDLAFDTRYTERSHLRPDTGRGGTNEIADAVVGEATGYNQEVRNERYADKEDTRVLMLGEVPFGKKYYNEAMMDGLSVALAGLRMQEGEEYFDPDNFAAIMAGDPAAENPFFHSKLREDAMIALDENEDVEPDRDWTEVFDDETLKTLMEEQNLAQTDQDVEEYVENIKERQEEEVDIDVLARTFTTINENIQYTRKELEKLDEATGVEIPWHLATGVETRKNWEYLKDIRRFDYVEEERENIEEIVDTIKPLEEALSNLADAAEGDAEDLQRYMEEGDLLDLEKGDLDEYEEYDAYETVLEQIDELNHEIRAKEHNLNARRVEQAINKALGAKAAQIFQKQHIDAVAQKILNNLTWMEMKEEAFHRIGNVQNVWRDNEIGRVEKNGWTFDIVHNLNQDSDVPLVSGADEALDEYPDKERDIADVFVQGYHDGWQHRVKRTGKSMDDKLWQMFQLSTLADKERIEEYGEALGLSDWFVKRNHKGIHDTSASLVDLKVEEDPEGEYVLAPEVHHWSGDELKRLGTLVYGDWEDVTEMDDGDVEAVGHDNPLNFSFWSDTHVNAPHAARYWHRHSPQELLQRQARYQDKHAPNDQQIFHLGDMGEGLKIFRGQGHQISPYQGRERHEIRQDIEARVDELAEAGLVEEPDAVKREALELFDERNLQQHLEMNLGGQFQQLDESLGLYFNYRLAHGAELYLFSGNHINNSTLDNTMEESEFAKLMLDQEYRGMDPSQADSVDELYDWDAIRSEERVHAISGNKDAIEYIPFGNWELLGEHEPDGNGKSHLNKAMRASHPDTVRIVATGDKHDFGAGSRNGVLYLAVPSSSPPNELGDKIGGADLPRGIISDLQVDEDADNGYVRYTPVLW